MKAFKISIWIIAGLIFLLLIVSFFLPSGVHVERSVKIRTTSSKAYKKLVDVTSWKSWSPWFQSDTNIQWTPLGAPGQPGYGFSWKSSREDLGEGSVIFAGLFPDTLLATETTFGKMGVTNMNFHIRPEGEEVEIVWEMESNGDKVPLWVQPLAKYFYLFMDQMAGPDFEHGLANLKTVLESDPTLFIGDFEGEFRDFPSMTFMGIREWVQDTAAGQWMSARFSQLNDALKSHSLIPIGVPFTIHFSASNGKADLEAAYSIAGPVGSIKDFHQGTMGPMHALVVKNFGSYQRLPELYRQTFQFLSQNGKRMSGPPVEFYFTDSVIQPDTAQWYTEVVFPLSD